MRKKILFLITIICGALIVNAQQKNEFEIVKESFQRMYPGAVANEWELEENNIFEVEFTMNEKKYEAKYQSDGTWLHTETDIAVKDLPEAVLNNFKISEWGGWVIDDVEELKTPAHETLYELEVKSNNKKHHLYFTPDGKLTSTSEKSKY